MGFERKLEGMLVIGVCVGLIITVIFVEHEHYFLGFHVLYGAIGVGFFLLTTKILSVIQKEGKQDD